MNEIMNITGITKPQQCEIDSSLYELTETKQTVVCLSVKEQARIVESFNAKFYDMSAEYIWSRTMNFLRDKISIYGNDFIADMLGYNNFSSVKDISEDFIIDLSADIGFINQTARIKLKNISTLLYHLQRREAVEIENEELTKSDALNIISTCIDYVLGADFESNFVPYVDMRRDLQSKLLSEDSPLLTSLANSPYFYIRTITHTMINLASDEKNPMLDVSLQNTVMVLKTVWSKLEENERWYIGITYSQAVSAGNAKLTKALRTVLNSNKGFDYVPESTKSDTYRRTARHLLAKHNEFDNFYNETEIANLLANMGTSIPRAAVFECLTAVLICRLGNSYGISIGAKEYLDAVLDSTSKENWAYFLNQMATNGELLYELAYVNRNNGVLGEWSRIVIKYNLDKLILTEKVNSLIQASACMDYYKVRDMAMKLYSAIYVKE